MSQANLKQLIPPYALLWGDQAKHYKGSGFNVKQVYTEELTCAMGFDARRFPFENQHLVFEMVSWSYGGQWVNVTASAPKWGFGKQLGHPAVNTLVCPYEKIEDCVTVDDTPLYFGKTPYSKAKYVIHLHRNPTGFILNWVIPLNGIMLINIFTFWLDPDGSVDRSALTITALLTVVAYGLEIKPQLPKLPYLTVSEAYMFFYGSVCLYATVEYLLVVVFFRSENDYDALMQEEQDSLVGKPNAQERKAERKRAVCLDRWSRICVPGLTVAFNVACLLFIKEVWPFSPAV